MTGPEDDDHRARDAATILPFLATALIVPPLVLIFAVPVRLAGVPLIVAYLFGVWAVVIAAAWLVAGRLKPQADEDDRISSEPGGQ